MNVHEIKRSARWLALLLLPMGGCAAPVEQTAAEGEAVQGAEQALDIHGVTREVGLGDSGADVAAVHAYLKRYGYLPNADLEQQYPHWAPLVDEEAKDPAVFGPVHEQAVKIYQGYIGVPQSGFVDEDTLAWMQKERCAHPENELARLDPSEKWNIRNDLWPLWTKNNLTFRITGCARGPSPNPASSASQGACIADSVTPITNALATWAGESRLTFTQAAAGATPDYDIRYRNEGTTAAGFPDAATCTRDTAGNPTSCVLGIAHSRTGNQQFVTMLSNVPWGWTAAALESVAVHEIGHTLGLAHSGNQSSHQVNASATMSAPIMFWTQPTPRVPTTDDRTAILSRYSAWRALTGLAVDIGVGGSSPTSPITWVTSGNNTVWRINGTSVFQDTSPNASGVSIAVTPAGRPWTVTSNNQVRRRNSSSCSTNPCNPIGVSWETVGTSARDIAIGFDKVWIVSNTATSGGNFRVLTWNGTLTGTGSFVAPNFAMDGVRITMTGNGGYPCVAKADGRVFCKPSNNAWQELRTAAGGSTCAVDIAGGRFGGLYAIGCGPASGSNRGVWVWRANAASTPGMFGNIDLGTAESALQWDPIDGFANRIAVGPDARPYVVQVEGGIFRRDPR